MKKRYFFECQYDGTHYSGWQIQPNAPTIQEVIEDRISNLFGKEKIRIVGCGRTDAGVHAYSSFFHVDLALDYSMQQLNYKLNKMLPEDISIERIQEVLPDAHARFDAITRTYRYFIHQKKLPFHKQYSYFIPQKLDIDKMNLACNYLLGKQDFTSFSKLHTDVNNNFCEIFAASWIQKEDQFIFEIKANRFLRDMVRAIVGTLLNVGKQKISPEEIQTIINKQDRGAAGFSVPAHGLFLQKVEYPYI